ncbi:plasmid replication protein RepB [Vibrio parahaemolyticus]|uniref:hypothetical protein n=1 Tax=Vibrio parahaemolyticus TaxID=670 RepID=UPI001D169BD2|nr:hypothetical protein [Vibrio parahaemolyticus]MCC3859114.1 plasmid replication protein RepB [Vibrio parahaemolyticus]
MQIKEAKIRFDSGQYKAAQVVEAVLGDGYHLALQGKKQSDNTMITSQRSGDDPRLFKTIDAAVRNAKDIGFLKIEVVFSI